jgi:DNA-binding HxlR family transcriptional regulator
MNRPSSCSIGRAMELLGERWTILILREAFWGVRRFTELQRNLGIARNILSSRLHSLVAAGILERRLYQSDPDRYEYRLTEKGRDLYPAVVAIMRWGDEHLSDGAEAPVVLRHTCGHDAQPRLTCSHCGEPLEAHDVTPETAVPATA